MKSLFFDNVVHVLIICGSITLLVLPASDFEEENILLEISREHSTYRTPNIVPIDQLNSANITVMRINIYDWKITPNNY